MNENNSSKIWMNQIFNIVMDILKRWQMIIFITVTCALSFDTYQSLTYVPMYRTEATFAVKSSSGYANQNNTTDQDVGETLTYIFSSNVFKKNIQKILDVDVLDGYFVAEVYGGTNVLHVYADSVSIRTSYDMMQALMDNYQEITHLVVGSANIDLLKDIVVPLQPYNSVHHMKNIILVGGMSFIGCIVVIALFSFMKGTIKSQYDIESQLNLHLIGNLPKETKLVSLKGFKRKKSILISQYSTSFQYVESFKRIRSRIERYCHKHHSQVIMVTSSLENEGKSSVAVNTALSLALNKHKVLLIDADLRKPSLHLILDEFKEHKGIDHILCENASLEETVVSLEQYHLDVLFGYHCFDNVSEYIQSQQMKQLFEKAKEKYDYIIVDSAPSRFLSDSRMLASLVDGILLVVKQNYASVSTILNTIEKLSLSQTPIIGCINNQSFSVSLQSGKYYGYKYGYHHYYNQRRKEQ